MRQKDPPPPPPPTEPVRTPKKKLGVDEPGLSADTGAFIAGLVVGAALVVIAMLLASLL